MSATTSKLDAVVRKALDPAGRDVVQCVDELLQLCHVHGLTVQCDPEACRVRASAESSEEVVPNPFRRSVFRAILARVAAICNAAHPGSVSPYGDHATLSIGATAIDLSFANTPDEQWLKLAPARSNGEP